MKKAPLSDVNLQYLSKYTYFDSQVTFANFHQHGQHKDLNIQYKLDEEAIKEETKWFGYYATATSLLEDDVKDIIAINKERWQIEYCFRNMKTMFKARAIYLWTTEHIKGHFEIVYLTLNLFKIIQMKVYRHYGYGNKLIGRLNKDDAHKQEITPFRIIETLRCKCQLKIDPVTLFEN